MLDLNWRRMDFSVSEKVEDERGDQKHRRRKKRYVMFMVIYDRIMRFALLFPF